MTGLKVLLVAGTHGNEINGPWLFEQWEGRQELIDTHGLETVCVIGNPAAFEVGRRYLDRDLNRSFKKELLEASAHIDLEVDRANELLALYGPRGRVPSQLAIDIHSTTSAMGCSLVIYGRRPADLALASLIQARLGLPVYLHEGDASQKGFLVEAWPCGLVIEIGPVPQGVLDAIIVEQTRLAINACLESIAEVISGAVVYPERLIVHLHLGSMDFPRHPNGQLAACLHPSIVGNDWRPLEPNSPIFLRADGEIVHFCSEKSAVPVFINEAAYLEKNIAMSLTRREIWQVEESWIENLHEIVAINEIN